MTVIMVQYEGFLRLLMCSVFPAGRGDAQEGGEEAERLGHRVSRHTQPPISGAPPRHMQEAEA